MKLQLTKQKNFLKFIALNRRTPDFENINLFIRSPIAVNTELLKISSTVSFTAGIRSYLSGLWYVFYILIRPRATFFGRFSLNFRDKLIMVQNEFQFFLFFRISVLFLSYEIRTIPT
jgi:hypothetical protein